MAFRIDKAIVRGEITNEVPGIVTGRIWLLGREKPIVLQLEGNCHNDLAGSTLTFENPEPSPQEIGGLVTHQVGQVGDMTASQKVRVPTVSDEELTRLIQQRQHIPSRWSNCLYLEWFSDTNGRVVVQTETFNTTLTEPRWVLPRENEPGGGTPGAGASDPFSSIGEEFVINPDDSLEDDFDADAPLDEFEWEQELRDADERADAYQEALERFHEHLDPTEVTSSSSSEQDPQLPLVSGKNAPAQKGDELPHKHHDFTTRAMELAVSLRSESERHGLHNLGAPGATTSPVVDTVASTVQFGGRLAAALDGIANGAEPEHGFVIAMLKRSLVPLNQSLEHCTAAIDSHASVPALVAALADARIRLFDLRHDILDLMAELRSHDQR